MYPVEQISNSKQIGYNNYHTLIENDSVKTPYEERGKVSISHFNSSIKHTPDLHSSSTSLYPSFHQTPSSVLSPPETIIETNRRFSKKQDRKHETSKTPVSMSKTSLSTSSFISHQNGEAMLKENEVRMQKRSLRTLKKHIISQIDLQNEVNKTLFILFFSYT